MADFDPDAFLKEPAISNKVFDPDAFLSGSSAPESKGVSDYAVDMAKATPDVVNRGIIAGTLGAPVDVTQMGLQGISWLGEKAGLPAIPLSEKPVGGSEWIGQKMEDVGVVSPTRRPGWELAAGLAPAVVTGGISAAKGVGTLAKKSADLSRLLMGGKTEDALSTLKTSVTSEAGLGEDLLRQSAYKSTEGEKAQVSALKEIEDAKFQTREKVRTSALDANKDVEASLKGISEKPVSDEEFGSFVSEKGKGNVKTINEATEREAIQEIKDPAFEKSRIRAQSGDLPATNPNSAPILEKAASDIRQTIADTPAEFRGGLEKRLQTLFGEEVALSEQELMIEQLRASIVPGYVAKTTKQLPLTLHQAEYLRRWAKDPILRERTGFGSLDDTRMKKLGDTIEQAMTAYEPDVKRYIDTYRAGKQSEELALGGRTGESAIETFGKKPQQIASYYLDGTKDSAGKLVNLVGGKSPELTEIVAGNIRNSVKDLDAAKTAAFLEKNQGLFEVFPEIGKSVKTLAANRAKSEHLASLSGKQQARLGEALKTTTKAEDIAGKAATPAEKAAQDIKMKLETLDKAKGQEVVTISKNIVTSLRENNLIDENKYQQLLAEIRGVGDSVEKAQHIKKLIRYAAYGVGGYGTLKATEFTVEALK